MNENVTITVTAEEVHQIRGGIMELPGKVCMPLLKKVDQQIMPQFAVLQKQADAAAKKEADAKKPPRAARRAKAKKK